MVGSQTGVSKGASHGIGHVLGGTAGVPHGYTSCVMLPHVLRFNHPVNAGKQARVSEALGRPEVPAADAVAELIAGLGLPTRLRDVGVKPEQLDRIAEGLDARPLDPHQPAQDRRPGGGPHPARRRLVADEAVNKPAWSRSRSIIVDKRKPIDLSSHNQPDLRLCCMPVVAQRVGFDHNYGSCR